MFLSFLIWYLNAIKKGEFESRLLDFIAEYVKSIVPLVGFIYILAVLNCLDAKTARDIIKKFNNTYDGVQVHTTLDSFLSIERIYVVLKYYYKLKSKQKFLQSFLESYCRHLLATSCKGLQGLYEWKCSYK